MSVLVERAKVELHIAGLLDPEKDFYGGMTGNAVLELLEVFSKQGHSGMSASIVIQLFTKLANHETISPLTGEEHEWNLISDIGEDDDAPTYQNNRNSAVFRKGGPEDGECYYINAIVKRTQNGTTWSGPFWKSKEDYLSGDESLRMYCRGYIKSFPFTPKKFVIDVIEEEVAPDDWEMYLKDPNQLEEIQEYYNLK